MVAHEETLLHLLRLERYDFYQNLIAASVFTLTRSIIDTVRFPLGQI